MLCLVEEEGSGVKRAPPPIKLNSKEEFSVKGSELKGKIESSSNDCDETEKFDWEGCDWVMKAEKSISLYCGSSDNLTNSAPSVIIFLYHSCDISVICPMFGLLQTEEDEVAAEDVEDASFRSFGLGNISG